jgi:hypothetical protein
MNVDVRSTAARSITEYYDGAPQPRQKQTLTAARQCVRSCVDMSDAVRPCSADGALYNHSDWT